MSPGDKVVMTWQWQERQGDASLERCHVFEITDIDQYNNATLSRNGKTFTFELKLLQPATDDDIAFDEGKP